MTNKIQISLDQILSKQTTTLDLYRYIFHILKNKMKDIEWFNNNEKFEDKVNRQINIFLIKNIRQLQVNRFLKYLIIVENKEEYIEIKLDYKRIPEIVLNTPDEFDINLTDCATVKDLIIAFESSIEILKQYNPNNTVSAYVDSVEGESELIIGDIEVLVKSSNCLEVIFKEKG